MNPQLELNIYILTVLELGIRILFFGIGALGAGLWTHIQWLKYRNLRDTAKKQKILDDINLKLSEDNRKRDAELITASKPLPNNVTRIHGDGIWEPNKR